MVLSMLIRLRLGLGEWRLCRDELAYSSISSPSDGVESLVVAVSVVGDPEWMSTFPEMRCSMRAFNLTQDLIVVWMNPSVVPTLFRILMQAVV